MKRVLTTRSKRIIRLFFLMLTIITGICFQEAFGQQTILSGEVLAQSSGPLVTHIVTNIADYPNDEVPKYEKLELSFQVENTVAGNYQLPYDPNPPHGIDLTYSAYQGISVDALFLPPGQTDWANAYLQPAFYYKDFEHQVKKDRDNKDREWHYPTGAFYWKVRFTPNVAGLWQYKLKAQDASGLTETAPQTLNIIASNEKGFLKVSPTDPRYFEFDRGDPFHALGFAYGPNGPPIGNSALSYELDFQKYQQNRINLLRVWIGAIYGVAWNRYLGGRNIYDGYLPRSALLPFTTGNRTTMAMRLDYEPEGDTGWFDACRFEFWDDPEAVKQNTDYRIKIKYQGFDIAGPRKSAYPQYGFVAKLGTWIDNCYEPGTGTVVTNYGGNSSDWQFIEGVWNSGSNNFLPRLYMGLENVTSGQVYIDSVSIQEVLGNGQYGPEIMIEPSMEYELYFPQKESYALDKFIELAEQHDIYLKLVLMDKNDNMYYKFEDNGDFVTANDNSDGFYGVGRTVNKTRWLQQAWWRYLQARWGYSPHIHSWEVTNEGDPWNNNHYAQTDELGKFMHCRVFGIAVGSSDGAKCVYNHPDDHLVTTSFWQSFPGEQFWASSKYPNVDYADVHAYVSTGWQNDPAHESDAAQFHLDYSADVRSSLDWYTSQKGLPTKPVIRGETGIDFVDQQEEQPDLARDTQGVWLHNFLWSTLDAGALTELYWWGNNIKHQPGPDGQPGLYEIYGSFANFMGPILLNKGHYQDLAPTFSNENLRIVGQKDLVNQKAHLWIQNKQHTWRNVVNSVSVVPQSGTITLSGFRSEQGYVVQWVDTLDSQKIIKTENIVARTDGSIDLTVNNLKQDIAAKIFLTRTDFVYLPIMVK